MKTRKRILAAVLTAIMMISLLPANTFATETVGNGEAESAVEAVSVSTEEQDVETTVEDVSEDLTEETSIESSETDEVEETADPAAEETIETVEETVEQAEEAEAAAEPEKSSPVTLEKEGSDYVVTVTYDASALLPEGTDIMVEEIKETAKKYDSYCDQALEAVQKENEEAEKINYIRLFDISLVDGEGNKVQPEAAVDVQIRLKDVKKVEESTQVVHFAGETETPEVVDAEIEGKDVSFEAEGFSVYAVIGTGDSARLTVNFYGAKNPETGEYTLIDTMYVKKADQASADRIREIVYDPGAGTIPNGYAFYGWSIGKENYSIPVDGSTEGSSIDDVRTYIQSYSIPEGDTGVLDIYAMMATHYTVKYIDAEGINLGTDTALVKTAGDEVTYTVNKSYTTDSEHNFEGWLVSDGINNITDPTGVTAATLFENGTSIKITDDVVFSVSAPEGHWLVFNENGKHATYNAPRFIKDGDVTSDADMLEMIRNGYTFGGWFTGAPAAEGGDPTGEEFTFGNPISQTTTIYAKWIPATSANYTIIIWKEGLPSKEDPTKISWDFEESITLSGTPGTAISTVEPQGSGNSSYARINGVNKQYTGFRYDRHDTGVTITPEGDAVVNVYYIRNTYTLTFRVTFLGIPIWTADTITEKYGTDISDHFPIDSTILDGRVSDWFSSLVRWNPQNGTTFSKPVVYIDTMPAESIEFRTNRSLSSEKEMYYYVEALDGQTPVRSFNGKEFVLLAGPLGARYNYFTESEDFLEINGYEKFGSEPTFNSQGQATGDILRCYYTRKLETIVYKDGSYYDGNNRRMSNGSTTLYTATGIPYGSDISSYNKGGNNYYRPDDTNEFVFEGWYIDQTCTTPYEFDRMPAGTITVYAKWRQVEYRVFLRPNAGTDTTLNWGSDSQAMNFRVAYGDKISLPEGTRRGWKFLGWHKDSELSIPVYKNGLILNEVTVTDDYDKTSPENYTDEMDPNGNGATWNADDADHNDRWWITKKFELFGKWSRVTIGADGIGIEYVAGDDGTNPPSDTLHYQDNTTAVAGAAPKAKTGKVFEKWVVQRWNGSEFVDTDVEVLPGQPFNVRVDDAKIVPEGSETPVTIDDVVEGTNYTYTIQVRAEYTDKEEVVPTHITWYKNDGSNEFYRENTGIKINEAVSVYGLGDEGVPTRNGYIFLGWAKDVERANAQSAPNTSSSKTTADFLEFKEGKFYLPGTATEITEVAADEVTPYEALYAVWEEKNEYFIYHHYVGGSAEDYLETCAMPESGTVNLATEKVTSGYMYGGYWDYTGEKKGNPITASGLTFAPTKHQYIYLKEVDQNYLKPQIYLVFSKIHGGLIRSMYGFVDYDSASEYITGGIDIGGVETTIWGEGNLTESLITVKKETGDEALTPGALFGLSSAVFGYADLTSYVKGGEQVLIKGYYVTNDNIKVTGYKTRVIKFDANDPAYKAPVFKGWTKNGGNTLTGIVTGTPDYTPVTSQQPAGFALMRSLTITAPADTLEYTITKVYDSGLDLQTVEEGSRTGEITYAERSGYYFAGWYMDSDFATPADFSDVKGDMTVYAKYVKAGDISVSFTRKSSKSGTTTFNTTVAVKGDNDLTDVTVTAGGSASVLGSRSLSKSGSGRNVSYTTQYKGTSAVKGLSLTGSFTASVAWTTADGTAVSGPAYKCTYILGLVSVR